MKKALAALLAGGLVLGAVSTAGAAKAKPKVVFTDAPGDAGSYNTGALPGAAEAGMDLVKATIGKKGSALEFKVTHSAMPAFGAFPEGARFLWHFNVGSTEYRLMVKSANIGKPDAVSQTGTERVGQVDTEGHFRVEECSVDATLPVTLSICEPIAYMKGGFDPASKSFSFLLPLKTLKLKAGSKILPGTGGASATNCQICWVLEYAERSLTPHTVIDDTVMTTTYKVPR